MSTHFHSSRLLGKDKISPNASLKKKSVKKRISFSDAEQDVSEIHPTYEELSLPKPKIRATSWGDCCENTDEVADKRSNLSNSSSCLSIHDDIRNKSWSKRLYDSITNWMKRLSDLIREVRFSK